MSRLITRRAAFTPLHLHKRAPLPPSSYGGQSSAPPNIDVCGELVNYANATLAQAVIKQHQSHLEADDHLNIAQSLRLTAHHYETTGLDAALIALAQSDQTPTPSADSVQTRSTTDVFALLNTFGNISPSNTSLGETVHFTSSDMEKGKQLIATYGISGVLRGLADYHSDMAESADLSAMPTAYESGSGHLSYATFGSLHPHFKEICVIHGRKISPREMCQLGVAMTAAAFLALLAAVCAGTALITTPFGAVVTAVVCALIAGGVTIAFLLLGALGCPS